MKAQQNQTACETSSTTVAGFGRRLGAMIYDLLLLAAVLIFVAIPFVLITGDTSKNFFLRIAFQVYLFAFIFFYYTGFWVRSGQTLGLLTWKLRLIAADGGNVTWPRAGKRFSAALLSLACGGLGFLWMLVDREKLTWHDRLSGTRVIRLPAPTPRQ
jgi:uncharacterized RDD family membrane protein YckC